MGRSRKRKSARKRVGHVSYYLHHGSWYIYYLDGKQQVRRRVGEDEQTAAIAAAEVNAQLAANAPTQFSFCPISVPELRRRFLDHHEHVRRSSLGTVRRYRSATQHLVDFVEDRGRPKYAHQIDPDEFVRHKVLDLLGDLALLGHRLRGHVRVERGGHSLHRALVDAICDTSEAWRLVEDGAPRAPGGHAPVVHHRYSWATSAAYRSAIGRQRSRRS